MPSPITLLTADASELILGGLLQPAWGVYLDGVPVIQPAAFAGPTFPALAALATLAPLLGATNVVPASASTVDFEYGQEFPLSNYPQEQGAFQSYNKVTLPFDVKLKLASSGSPSARQAFLSTCQAIASSIALFSVVTPEQTFDSVNCTHIDWKRNARQGNTLIQVDLWFQQIPVVSATNFQNTQQPGDAGQQALGTVQPQAATPFVTNNWPGFN